MRLKVKKIRRYYKRITEAELWLPPYPGFRQFRFFLWDDKQETVVVRVIKDNIRHKKTLLSGLETGTVACILYNKCLDEPPRDRT